MDEDRYHSFQLGHGALPVRTPVRSSFKITCRWCNNPLDFDEDIVLLKLVKPKLQGGVFVYNNAVDEDGDMEIEALLMHAECFDILWFNLRETARDCPPREEVTAALTCDACESSIRMGEKMIGIYTGHLQVSRLGDVTYRASADEEGNEDPPMTMCLSCALIASEVDSIDGWNVLSQNGECDTCTKARCWRAGRCVCECHLEE